MLIKIFKQVVVTICLVSMLFLSPAVALASQNIEAHAPKEDVNITDKIHNGDRTSTIIGINTIIDDTNRFGIQNGQHEVTACPRTVTIGEIVGLIVSRVMADPVAGVAAEMIIDRENNHAITSHKQENDVSIKSLSIEKYSDVLALIFTYKSL
jgi:hypothetical protein